MEVKKGHFKTLLLGKVWLRTKQLGVLTIFKYLFPDIQLRQNQDLATICWIRDWKTNKGTIIFFSSNSKNKIFIK